MVGVGWRGITLGKTDDLVSAPSRCSTVAGQGESGGSEVVVNRQDRGRRTRLYENVSITGIAAKMRVLPAMKNLTIAGIDGEGFATVFIFYAFQYNVDRL